MRSLVVITLGALAFTGSSAANASGPTCSQFGIDNHGEHVVGDYITGIGALDFGDNLGWPPNGSEVGATISENGGAFNPGGPAHMESIFAPGASACLDSASPGLHLPPE